MSTRMQTVSAGFGGRLRDERERVGMTQTAFAEVAGIKRMAQGQYESEVRSPTVRYLSAVAAAGIDLHYVLFGSRVAQLPGQQRELEKKAFELVEVYARQQADGQLGAEGRYAMFEFLRAYMARCAHEDRSPPVNLDELLAGLKRE